MARKGQDVAVAVVGNPFFGVAVCGGGSLVVSRSEQTSQTVVGESIGIDRMIALLMLPFPFGDVARITGGTAQRRILVTELHAELIAVLFREPTPHVVGAGLGQHAIPGAELPGRKLP